MTPTHRRLFSPWSAALGLLLVLSGCSDDPVPGPGTLTASLVSPNGDEGAAVVLLLGDGIESISGAGATEVYSFTSTAESQARVVLIDQSGGLLTFQLDVADVLDPPSWVVEDVAGPDDARRADLSGYRVEFAR